MAKLNQGWESWPVDKASAQITQNAQKAHTTSKTSHYRNGLMTVDSTANERFHSFSHMQFYTFCTQNTQSIQNIQNIQHIQHHNG